MLEQFTDMIQFDLEMHTRQKCVSLCETLVILLEKLSRFCYISLFSPKVHMLSAIFVLVNNILPCLGF